MIARRHIFALLSAALLSACASTPSSIGTKDTSFTTVYLVRHAEKLSGKDPSLTEAGHQRADALATALSDANLEYIHSSDYARTRETAAPIAALTGLPVAIYDAGNLEAIGAEILLTQGTHLVVGHSNTTPQLVDILGGDGGAPINEAAEYDRLYIVTIDNEGRSSSTLRRYGTAYKAQD